MDLQTAHELNELDKRFYHENAHSFSATRPRAWQGWEHVTNLAKQLMPTDTLKGNKPLVVTDVACGNARLLSFLEHKLPKACLHYQGIDNEPTLAEENFSEQHPTSQVTLAYLDIIGTLLDSADNKQKSSSLDRAIKLPDIKPANIVCCFGFMHHIPGDTLRVDLMRELVSAAQPGGVIALSFWQFMHDARLAQRAHKTMEMARKHAPFPGYDPTSLDLGDYLLGWQESECFRYCHSFEEDEIDTLVKSLGSSALECDRFSADGASGTLNRYVVLQRS